GPARLTPGPADPRVAAVPRGAGLTCDRPSKVRGSTGAPLHDPLERRGEHPRLRGAYSLVGVEGVRVEDMVVPVDDLGDGIGCGVDAVRREAGEGGSLLDRSHAAVQAPEGHGALRGL